MKSLKTKNALWVQKDGRIYSIPLGRKSAHRGAGGTEAQELMAPFSCKVLKVHVKPGQSVAAGDSVAVVEAMKMEYSYASPREGVIEEVLVREGETMSAGQHFVRWKEKA